MPPAPSARTYRGTPRNVALLARALRAGELVAVPTETVYGLAGNALDPAACKNIFRAKGRPADDPLIVHLYAARQLATIAVPNEAAERLARAFWPGPLTLVLPKQPAIPDIVSAGLPTVAVRVPSHPLFRRLLRAAGLPLAAPSANPFGYVSPTTADHVSAGLGSKIRHILDGGPCRIGVESTIVDVRDPLKPRLLRPGAIPREALEHVLGRALGTRRKSAAHGAQVAPGLLARHYSPRTPAVLHSRILPADAAKGGPREAWVFVARPKQLRGANIFWLDPR
ncbi:MAG TPA: L-threonylcarbamoyladenylate synthase, partial [Opitutus sp.]|nr:L-threonylcarbamoyladenylate synthase [Opitutus sp.]